MNRQLRFIRFFYIFSAQAKAVVHRAAAAAEIKHVAKCAGNVFLGPFYGICYAKPFCKVCCNCAGKGASGAVCIGVFNVPSQKPLVCAVIKEQVVGVVDIVPAFAEYGAAVGCPDTFGCFLHILFPTDTDAREGFGFGDVGSD